MINKDEMLTLLRSVAVPSDVEEGMGHAFDLGVEWERARVMRIIELAVDMQEVIDKVLTCKEYP
jgi:hypothetical protein